MIQLSCLSKTVVLLPKSFQHRLCCLSVKASGKGGCFLNQANYYKKHLIFNREINPPQATTLGLSHKTLA